MSYLFILEQLWCSLGNWCHDRPHSGMELWRFHRMSDRDDVGTRVENERGKILYRPVPFSIFDPIVSVFKEKI
jgi:hypothetical protein